MDELKRSWSPLVLVLLLSTFFFMVFLIVSGIFYIAQSPFGGKRTASASSFFGSGFRNGSVGVVEVNGVILDSKKILAKLERFEENDQIKAVVVRLNSPGGAVAPSQEIYEAVKNYSKPLVVSMASVAASGAYYVACGAKKVFANAGTMTGSIGVIMEFADLEKLYEWAKIKRYVVKTGAFKDIGAEFRTMTGAEKQLLQKMIDDVLGQFKRAIVIGRKLTLSQVTALADGRIFSGTQAKSVHLVDEIGTLRDAIQEAAKLAGIQGKPNVVTGDPGKRSLLDLLLDDSAWSDTTESFIQRMFGMTGFSPGLYFMMHAPGMH